MDLFTKPAPSRGDCEEDGCREEVAAPIQESPHRTRFAVNPRCAGKVNSLLSAQAYSKRWPRIPRHELWASSVQHPHEPSWRWLLHTRRVGDTQLDANGQAPTVQVCRDCGHVLSADSPRKMDMPKYALANDNWIGRMPFDLTP
eukprot:7479837-Karenia_brevis.AAC.1